MVKFTFAAILAASIAAPALGAAISFDRLESREVAASPEELFGRAVAEIFNDVYTREELSEVMGRDIEEFTTRELSELMSREYDVDESLITRDLLDASELDARAPIFKWIKKKLGFGGNAAAAASEQQQTRDFEDDLFDSEAREFEDDLFEARDSMEDHDLEARAPIFKWIKKKLGFGGNAAAAAEQQQTRDFDEDMDARDFDEEMFEARAETPAPAPKQPNIIEKFLNLFRNKNHPGAKKAAAAKKNGGEAPAPAAPAAPAGDAPAARDFLDIPEERSYDDEEMFERDFDNVFEERDVEDDMMERDFEEDVYERDFEDEVYERDYDVEEILERELDEELLEREFEDILERDYEFDELD